MNDIITARDPEIIAAEINTIKKKVQQAVIFGSIEIGGKLMEAKSLVPQGEWGKWLENNVEYSQSTAENLMKLYKEYGGDQESLFDTWTNSQTFGKLSYTQHLALLALPFSDRQEFAEANNVADMSTRQLQEAVKQELEEERCLHAETQGELEETRAKLRDAQQDLIDMQQKLSTAKSSEESWQTEIDKLRGSKEKAEKAETDAQKKMQDLQKQLDEAKKREAAIREDLKKAKENPEIPDSVMEALRKEAEASAAEKNTGDIKRRLEEAEAAWKASEEGKKKAEEELTSVQKRLKMADPDIMEYNTLAQKLISDYNVLDGLRRKVTVHDKETGEKLKQFQEKMVAMFQDSLGVKK